MGSITHEHEITSSIPPQRLFNAFIVNGDKLIPQVMPQAIKSIETLEGDGGAGTITLTTFVEGSQIKSVKQVVEALDKEKCSIKYSIIEGDVLVDVVEKVTHEIEIVASSDGGSIFKNKSTYYPKGVAKINEDEIKVGKEKIGFLFKAVETYLIAHPDLY